MNNLEKLRVLLPHWIEHQAEHTTELRDWANRLQDAGKPELVEGLLAAAASLQQAGDHLSNLLEKIGEKRGSQL
jgi:hypothetical protein